MRCGAASDLPETPVSRAAHGAAPTGAGEVCENTGLQMRQYLVVLLLVASLARCASLLLDLTVTSKRDHRWLVDVCGVLPDMLFLSAFSVVVLFLAQLHYTTTIVTVPLLGKAVVAANAICYLVVVAIATAVLELGAPGSLRKYLMCFVGDLNILLAAALMYYGITVGLELAETARKQLPNKRLTCRIKALSVACPLAFVARGVWYLLVGLSLVEDTPGLSLALCILGEWAPCVLTLAMIGSLPKEDSARNPSLSFGDSTDSEAPLLQNEHATPRRELPGGAGPGMAWRQLYPPQDAGAASPDKLTPNLQL